MQNDRETLSTQMDGEDRTVDGTLLAAIAADDESRATWARYHLIGDVMRDGLIGVAPTEFAEQLRGEIDREPTVMAPRRTARPLLRPVAGFAIAASVAALAVVGIKQTAPEQQLNGTPEIATTAPAVTESVQLATARPDANARPDIEVIEESLPAHRRLNSYLVKFNEQRSSLGVPGVNPYVRIVGFESD